MTFLFTSGLCFLIHAPMVFRVGFDRFHVVVIAVTHGISEFWSDPWSLGSFDTGLFNGRMYIGDIREKAVPCLNSRNRDRFHPQ